MFSLLIQDPATTAQNYAPKAEVDAFGQLTKLASTFDHVDGLFYFTYAVCIFFFVVIVGVLLFSVVKYRRKTWDQPPVSNTTHNTPLEVIWTVIPLIIVMVMFAWGYMGARDMTIAPAAASQNSYKATAKQWNWTFSYPNSKAQSYNEVWVEAGKPVEFLLESTDVLHAFFLPDFRVKRDIIPGRYQSVWFEPRMDSIGEHHLFCAEYCGQDHSRMYAKLHVVSSEEFATKPWDKWDDSTPEALAKSGASLYSSLCAACHTVNGTPSVGPSWQGLFTKNADGTFTGRQREVIEAGQRKTITVDEAYIIESIRNPDLKKVAEEPYVRNAMSAFTDANLPEYKVQGLIAYMKSLAETK